MNRMEKNLESFHSKIKVDSDTGCWRWTAALSPKGYAEFNQFYEDGSKKRVRGHIFSFLHVKKETKQDKDIIRHTCPNRDCVNPNHLYAARQKEASIDSWNSGARDQQVEAYGRTQEGELNRNSKLTEEEVIQIKNTSRSAMSDDQLAKKYDVSYNQINGIRNGTRWSHLDRWKEEQ